MSLSEILEIGDKVILNVDPEKRYWTDTYNDVPDGTEGVICGFYDAIIYEPRVPVLVNQPGVYHKKGAASVWLPDGRIVPGDYCTTMVDKDEEERRDKAMRDEHGCFQVKLVRIGDLPETRFWEMDKVLVSYKNESDELQGVIRSIDYHSMHDKCKDGSPYPFYRVDFNGSIGSGSESNMKLVERGNVWKYFHNEPVTFANLKEEASFFQLIGQAEEIRNPDNGLFSWSEDEVIAAIKKGTVHGFMVENGLFATGPHISARRFKNEELGKRVASATLEGFGMAA